MILHENNNNQIWLVGAIESRSKKLRIDVINVRNEENIRIFITNHIAPGTHIITDGWPSYNFLDGYESVWKHEIHNHSLGNWGFGDHSTSHIEGTWSLLKKEISSIYNIIPKSNYIYYIREAEFRLNINKKSIKEKMKIFEDILKFVYDLTNYEFYDEEELLDFQNYDI